MKLLGGIVLLLCLLSASHAVSIEYFTNDYAQLYTAEEIAQLDVIGEEIQASGVAQYAIVTVNSTDGVPIETYAIDLAQGNLGDTETDNGLLLLIAVNDHAYRFEVGSGLEGTLNDAKVGRIGRTYLVPAFKEGQYGAGTIAASVAIRDLLINGTEPALAPAVSTDVNWVPLLIALAILGWVVVAAIREAKRRGKYYDAALAAANIATASDWWRRGGGGGSGGFGGFGGGGFSGGGASGGW